MFVSPRPRERDIPQLYDEKYFVQSNISGYKDNYFENPERQEIVRAQLKFLSRHVSKYGRKGSLLEIGCADGSFLNFAKGDGWITTGVELSPQAAARAQALGLEIKIGTLERANQPDASTDVVVAWEMIEHSTDPAHDLTEMFRVLKPGGLLFLSTPNVRRAKITRNWVGFRSSYEHLYYFDPLTVSSLLKKVGFEPIHVITEEPYVTIVLAKASHRSIPDFWVAPTRGPLLGALDTALGAIPNRLLRVGHSLRIVARKP